MASKENFEVYQEEVSDHSHDKDVSAAVSSPYENDGVSVTRTRTQQVVGATKSFFDRIQIAGTQGYSTKTLFLLNYDLAPVPEERRTWRWWNFVNFWIADAFNINSWEIAATGVEAGLAWWQAWITVWLGYTFVTLFIGLTSRVGTYYHISFPVSCRASFGIWGSLWPIINRVVMACVWYGVQSSLGGNCVEVMLKAIFGNDLDTRIHNTIPAKQNITSFGMLSFFLFWLAQLPFIYLHPETVRHFFTVKAIICPIAGFGFMIWALVKAHGGGPVVKQPATISGSTFGWAFVVSTMNALSNYATLIVNAPDFSRMAKTPKSPFWSQLLTIPIAFGITCLIGVLVSSASNVLFGEVYWNPVACLSEFLVDGNSGTRAGAFFVALGFAVAQIGTNISANSLSAGCDATALLPRYMNIRRGGFLCSIIGFAICPWQLMSSSSMFTTYLSAYAVFLSSIAGVIVCQYFVVGKGYINLKHLYIADDTSDYYYWKGINWRAYVAYICGILPNIVGFVGATKTHVVPDGATKVYDLSYFCGFFAAFLVYIVLNLLSPPRSMPVPIKQKAWMEEWQEVEDFDNFLAEKRGDIEPIKSSPDDDFKI